MHLGVGVTPACHACESGEPPTGFGHFPRLSPGSGAGAPQPGATSRQPLTGLYQGGGPAGGDRPNAPSSSTPPRGSFVTALAAAGGKWQKNKPRRSRALPPFGARRCESVGKDKRRATGDKRGAFPAANLCFLCALCVLCG